jgi:hypothetical protein
MRRNLAGSRHRCHCRSAFTLQELLLVAGAVALLGLIAVGWRARSADLPRRKACQSNLKQLLSGFEGFVQANGRLPWAARSGAPASNDWIFWQPDRFLDQSALAPFIPHFGSTLLRCPADPGFQHREYPYSYTMNAHVEKLPPASLANASDLILLFEEAFPNDGACAPGETADALAKRHLQRTAAGFMDGHVETISASAAGGQNHVQPHLK